MLKTIKNHVEGFPETQYTRRKHDRSMRRLSLALQILSFFIVFFSITVSGFATTLYLNQGQRLSTEPPSRGYKYNISSRNALEWSFPLKGDISGTQYGFFDLCRVHGSG